MIKLSIIVPTYNVSKYINELLSDLKLLYNIELIFIDDGSSDDTSAIIKRELSDFQVPVRLQEINHQGSSNARNLGIKLARGEYIMFIDADDRVYADVLQSNIDNLDTTQDIISFSKDSNNREVSSNVERIFLVEEILNLNNSREYLPSPVLKFYNINYLRQNRILFPLGVRVGEDMIFNVEAVLKSECILLSNKTFYLYRQNPTSITKKSYFDILENSTNFILIVKNILLNQSEKYSEFKLQLNSIFKRTATLSWINDSIRYIQNKGKVSELKRLRRFTRKQVQLHNIIQYKFSTKKNIIKWLLLFNFFHLASLLSGLKKRNWKARPKFIEL